MNRDDARAVRRRVLAAAGQPVPAMRPRRQRRVHQPPVRIEHGEVDGGTGTVHVGNELAQAMGERLFAAHACQRGHRHVDAVGGLLEGADQQRVRRQLGEHPVAIFEGGLNRGGEPHHATAVVGPVAGVEGRLIARVE